MWLFLFVGICLFDVDGFVGVGITECHKVLFFSKQKGKNTFTKRKKKSK